MDWSLPTITRNVRTEVLQDINAKFDSLAKLMDGDSHTNLPTGAIRWSTSNDRFEKWSGSAWSNLSTNLTGTAKTANNLSDLASASTARSNLGLKGLALLDAVDNNTFSGTALALTKGGTGATTASGARSALGLGTLATINSPLPVANGGTGATTAADARAALGLGTVSVYATPLGVAYGGTGASSAATARSALGAAGSGANTDITSLAGIWDIGVGSGNMTLYPTAGELRLKAYGAINMYPAIGILTWCFDTSGAFAPYDGNANTTRDIGTSTARVRDVYFHRYLKNYSAQTYGVSNRSTQRALDCNAAFNDTSWAFVLDVLGTLIYDLQQIGLLL